MADGIGWKTAELQIETLVPGILFVLGTHAVISKHFSITIRIPVPDDAFIQAALFVATAYAAGVIGSVLCRVILVSCQPCNVATNVLYFFHNQHRGIEYEEIHRDTYRR